MGFYISLGAFAALAAGVAVFLPRRYSSYDRGYRSLDPQGHRRHLYGDHRHDNEGQGGAFRP